MKIISIQPQNLGINSPQEWRSWLNDLTEWQHDLLHNHRPEGGEIYRYPLVQYNPKGFKGINEGATLLMKLLPYIEAQTELAVSTQKHEIEVLPTPTAYELKRWQPFNSENYKQWNATKHLADCVAMLENILVANVLGFCRAVGYEVPNRVLAIRLIENIDDLGFQRFNTLNANLHRRTFTIRFECNLSLPMGVGLGRGMSKGFGTVQQLPVFARKNYPRLATTKK